MTVLFFAVPPKKAAKSVPRAFLLLLARGIFFPR